jgi:hypothetical protein
MFRGVLLWEVKLERPKLIDESWSTDMGQKAMGQRV